MFGCDAVEDAEDDELGDEGVAFVGMKDLDAKGRDDPADNGNDDDSDYYRHASIG